MTEDSARGDDGPDQAPTEPAAPGAPSDTPPSGAAFERDAAEDAEPGAAEAPRRLPRVPEGRMLLGVCSGLGRRTGIDPVVFRVGFGLMVFASGWGILVYFAAAALMPSDEASPSVVEQIVKRRFDADAVLAILALLLGIGVLVSLPGPSLEGSITAITVLALGLLVAQSRGVNLVQATRSLPERLQGHPADAFATTPPDSTAPPYGTTWRPGHSHLPPGAVDLAALSRRTAGRPGVPYGTGAAYGTAGEPEDSPPYGFSVDTQARYGPISAGGRIAQRPRSGGLVPITLLVALAAAAATIPAWHTHPQDQAAQITLSTALAVIGLGLVVSAWIGRGRGLVAAGALLSVALVLSAIPGTTGLSGGRIGGVLWRPTDNTQSEQTYKLIAGDGRLDLTALPLRPGQRVRVQAEMGVGQFRVTVPANARVELSANAGLGDVTIGHQITSGPRAKVIEVLQPDGNPKNPPVIELHVRGRIGDVEVTRV